LTVIVVICKSVDSPTNGRVDAVAADGQREGLKGESQLLRARPARMRQRGKRGFPRGFVE